MKHKLLLFITLFFLTSLTVIFYFQNNQKKEFFTFIILPDTQKYTMYSPQVFTSQTEWVVKNKDVLNIKFVSHLGDIVQSGALENGEWETASKAMSLFETADIPYGIIPGNHDIDKVSDSSEGFTKYNQIFPVSRFQNKPWFGGSYHEYQNNYQLVTINKIDFIIMNIEVDPTDDILNWANKVLAENSQRHAIVTTHAYLSDKGERFKSAIFRANGNSGEQIWEKLIKNQCNVFLVLSGHSHSIDGENNITSTNDCGKSVYQIVQDYQDRIKGGNGLLRIYKFYPNKKELMIYTYSPVSNAYENDKNSKFTLKLPF